MLGDREAEIQFTPADIDASAKSGQAAAAGIEVERKRPRSCHQHSSALQQNVLLISRIVVPSEFLSFDGICLS